MSNCAEFSSGISGVAYPPTLVREPPLICETPNSNTFFRVAADSRVEIIIPVYGTAIRITAVIRIAVPYTGMIISTRESAATRKKVLELGVSQISGGSRTSVGGYATPEIPEENSAQFDISDTRTLDEVVNWLLELGHLPSFCTACYRAGRTGDRFMSLVKTGQIANCCAPNALMTLKEYLQDYASPDTYAKGIKLIEEEIQHIPNPKIKEIALRNLKEIEEGKRDFRF